MGNNSDKEYNKTIFFIENEYVSRRLLRKGGGNTEARAPVITSRTIYQ
jgi:hypothetical protein